MSGDSDLYARLLGERGWSALAPAVRSLHQSGPPETRNGSFEVVRGHSFIARLSGWVMGMPAEGKHVPVALSVKSSSDADVWQRSFAGKSLVTRQYERPGGFLAERMACVECRFRLEAQDGALVYRQVGAALCLGPFRIPLPSWLWPRVNAVARPGPGDGEVNVDIRIAAPLAGEIIAYRGMIRVAAG